MSLTAADVTKIAHLARLGIQSQDIGSYTQDLSNTLALMTQMSSLNTDHITPMAHPMEQAQILRPDMVTEPNNRDKFQLCAPQIEAGLYLVPRVIE